MIDTEVITVDPVQPEEEKIEKAAEKLRAGGLVAFPTETVYGLGANALDEEAVGRIFEAKGRPADNPLIVHVAEPEQVCELAAEVPLNARRAMEAFWPGPLTVVLPSRDRVPKAVTGGLDTVAIRMPGHPVALSLLKKARLPVAAPSANSSGKPSPTEAEHVLEDLRGKIDVLLEGGPASVGVESTVLDMTGDPPVILRPGGVPQEQLEAVLGHLDVDRALISAGETPKAPGMKYRHYSPRAEMVLVTGMPGEVAGKIVQLAADYKGRGLKVAVMASREMLESLDCTGLLCGDLGSREDLAGVAAGLFRTLRSLDGAKPDIIITEGFPEKDLGRAVMNRLSKAASRTVSSGDA